MKKKVRRRNSEVYKMYRKTDPATSKAAAESVDTTTIKQKIVDELKKCGKEGCTPDVVAENLGRCISTVTPRFKPMEKEGLIYRTKRKRPSIKTGNLREVWVTAEHAEPDDIDFKRAKEKPMKPIHVRLVYDGTGPTIIEVVNLDDELPYCGEFLLCGIKK